MAVIGISYILKSLGLYVEISAHGNKKMSWNFKAWNTVILQRLFLVSLIENTNKL
jgi:hypothetical protein